MSFFGKDVVIDFPFMETEDNGFSLADEPPI